MYSKRFDARYKKLVKACEPLMAFYDIDKVKTYSVYVWTKGDSGRNVFDIYKNKIVYYGEKHEIPKGQSPHIEKIQKELKRMSRFEKWGI